MSKIKLGRNQWMYAVSDYDYYLSHHKAGKLLDECDVAALTEIKVLSARIHLIKNRRMKAAVFDSRYKIVDGVPTLV